VQRDFDLVIAGAGLVGAALAVGSSARGLRVAIVDRVPPPRGLAPDPRGLALNHQSVAILESLGVWPELVSQACPIHQILVSQRGHFGMLRLGREDIARQALGFVCPADRLQQVILSRLAATARVEVHWQTTLEATRIEDTRRLVEVRGAAGAETWRTALLVGADGTESTVRTLAGIEAAREDFDQVALVCNVDVSQPQANTAYERFTTSGPQALLPLGGRRYVMVRCARPHEAEALLGLSDAAYLQDAQQRFGYRLGLFSAPGPRRPWPLQRLRAARLTGERLLLMGNAATTVHPNAAQGLNLGLRDVQATLDWLGQRGATEADPGSAPALDTLAAQRLPDHRAIARTTDALAALFTTAWPGVPAVLAFGLMGLDRFPPLRRLLLGRLALGAQA
jgi:2-octaprenyl-6-methoxyphenol hydroxylase